MKNPLFVALTLVLCSCADGKLVWDLEKPQEEASQPTDSDFGVGSAFINPSSAQEVRMGVLHARAKYCLSEVDGAIAKRLVSETFKPEDRIYTSDFVLNSTPLPLNDRTLLGFELNFKNRRDDLRRDNDNDEVPLRSLTFTQENSEKASRAKLKISRSVQGRTQQLISKQLFPSYTYQKTVRDPELDSFGDPIEATRVVSGVTIVLGSDLDLQNPEVTFLKEGRADVAPLKFNVRPLLDCLSNLEGV